METRKKQNQLDRLRIIAAGGGAPHADSAPAIREGLSLSNVDKPSVLIIPSAKRTAVSFERAIPATKEFFRRMGLSVALLHNFNQAINTEDALEMINTADFVYTAGGDTLHMLEQLRKAKIESAIADKALRGELVLSGVSAGAIMPMAWGHSDSLSYRPEASDTWDYIRVDGMGLVPTAITPHYNTINERLGARSDKFHTMLTEQGDDLGFGIDNYAALRIADGNITQFQSNPNNFIHVVRNNNNRITSEPMTASDSIRLSEL